MQLYPDVLPTLEKLAGKYRLAVVSNIDDDLLQATPLHREFDLVCTAERARGYKPDGTLFRYLIANSGVGVPEISHVKRHAIGALTHFRCRYARFGRHSIGGCLPWCTRAFAHCRRLVC
jgi:hypothetical protein